MNKNVFTPAYTKLFLITTATALLIFAIFIVHENISYMKKMNEEISYLKFRYDYPTLVYNAEVLQESSKLYGISYFNGKQADLNVLKFADSLSDRYNGQITSNLIHEDGYSVATMDIATTFNSPEAFIDMLQYLVDNRNPMVFVNKLSMSYVDTYGSPQYEIRANLDIYNPYLPEGSYEQ